MGAHQVTKEYAMSSWNYDLMAMGDVIRAERERQVARGQLEREARAGRQARSQGAGAQRQARYRSTLRHRLAVVCHLAQEQPSAPTA